MEIRYSPAARAAMYGERLPPLPELLYFTANPAEVPLVLPARAREWYPELAERIDAGHALRAAAGLPDVR